MIYKGPKTGLAPAHFSLSVALGQQFKSFHALLLYDEEQTFTWR